jgi:hypothetical protein
LLWVLVPACCHELRVAWWAVGWHGGAPVLVRNCKVATQQKHLRHPLAWLRWPHNAYTCI